MSCKIKGYNCGCQIFYQRHLTPQIIFGTGKMTMNEVKLPFVHLCLSMLQISFLSLCFFAFWFSETFVYLLVLFSKRIYRRSAQCYFMINETLLQFQQNYQVKLWGRGASCLGRAGVKFVLLYIKMAFHQLQLFFLSIQSISYCVVLIFAPPSGASSWKSHAHFS